MRALIISAIVAFLFVATYAQADTIIYYIDAIDGDDGNDGRSEETAFLTIQKGIDTAVNGDEVIVADGTYTGDGNRDLDFGGKAITVRSENGPENCIIDCQGTETEPHRGFYFHCFEDANSIVNGLTVINGYAPPVQLWPHSETEAYGEGGAIFCYQSSPTISNCRLLNNYADSGGAISTQQSDLIITQCTIMNNVSGGGGGAGISCIGYNTPSINSCVIAKNRVEGDDVWLGFGPGGGIYCHSNAIITNCVITENAAGSGGGICTSGDNFGGGWSRITNCTFSNNTATYGGAVNCFDLSNPSILNCILWGDSATYGPEIAMSPGSWGASISISYSNVQGGWLGQGNIDDDPLFVEPGYWDPNGTPNDPNDDFWIEGDYHLQPGSPCIDAGDPNYIPAPDETDLDGNPRITGAAVDMGAYEANPIEAKLRMLPRVINRRSRMRYVIAIVRLPEGIERDDIDSDEPLTLYPGEIEAERQYILGGRGRRRRARNVRLLGLFDKAKFTAELPVSGSVEVDVVSRLKTGQYFYGTDTVWITARHQRQWHER